ncbi:MAG: SAM-dependent methyltransferase [bacterium]|nr:MAG: SAM-dependent methyltransferase [bacterium]
MEPSDSPLHRAIVDEILLEGPLRFDRYMALCLYHPAYGYYQRGEVVTGREGDFYTAPHVHRLFGAAISNWILARSAGPDPAPGIIVELGPGNGHLAGDILSHWTDSGTSRDVQIVLVEESAAQRDHLRGAFAGKPVRVASPGEWDGLPNFTGVVLANEFFDALPLRVICRENGELREIHVSVRGVDLCEVLLTLDPRSLGDEVRGILRGLPEGQRMEFAPEMETWLQRISRKLDSGSLLVLDYGDVWETLSAPWRASGTLRCYHRHRVDSDPYRLAGEKDITAHVNFTLLEDLARSAGFVRESFTTQASFLIRAGILDLLHDAMRGREGDPEVSREWLTIKNLIHDEEGMGEVFKAMVLTKGQEPDPSAPSRQAKKR